MNEITKVEAEANTNAEVDKDKDVVVDKDVEAEANEDEDEKAEMKVEADEEEDEDEDEDEAETDGVFIFKEGKISDFWKLESKALMDEGSFGKVYRASLGGDVVVAIKEIFFTPTLLENIGLINQISHTSGLRHENLVELIGYYANYKRVVIAYEFATMGSLHDILHGRKGVQGAQPGPVLNWMQRVSIAVDAARGLEFLHHTVEPSITHRDIRSSNVLLFNDFKAKISEFNFYNEEIIDSFTPGPGSLGYSTPEYEIGGELSQKSDIYCFGVVLLELLTGKKHVDHTKSEGQENLVELIKTLIESDEVIRCVDPKLNGDFPLEELNKVVAMAGLCVQDEPDFRPSMSIVVRALLPLLNDVDAGAGADADAEADADVDVEVEADKEVEADEDEVVDRDKDAEADEDEDVVVDTDTDKDVDAEVVADEEEEAKIEVEADGDEDVDEEETNGVSIFKEGKITEFWKIDSKALIGEGSYGKMYRANLWNGEFPVVIKELLLSPTLLENIDLINQISHTSGLKHENLVELIGYYANNKRVAVAYEFATMGSLHDILHGRKGVQGTQPGPVLNWMQRVSIAVDAARGLEYLHHTVEPSITHRDIRSSNVLLFDDFKAKIAEFNFYNEEIIDSFTPGPGSFGYKLPELEIGGELSQKSDIYCFGVVLLELLTGRKHVDHTMPDGQQNLVSWIQKLIELDEVKQCVDPKLNGIFPLKAVNKVAAMAGLCMQDEPAFRPSMSIVVRALQPLVPAPEPTP